MQDIQEGARRGVNAGWGGTPGERPTSNKRKRLQAARAGSQDKGKRLARGQRRMGGASGEEPALTAKVLPTGGSPGGNRANPIDEPRYLIDGILRSASALAFLL